MTAQAPVRKVPRWVIGAAIVLSGLAVTRMLMQQRAQRRALRDSAVISRSPASERERDPALTIGPDGRAVVAWTSLGAGAGTTDKLGVRALLRGSHAWGEPTAVTAPEPLRAGPLLASTTDGTTWLAFAGTRIFIAHAPVGTLDFTVPADGSGSPAGATVAAPVLAASGEVAWLAFREDDPGTKTARLVVRLLRPTDPVERLVAADGASAAAALPGLCADGTNVTVVWLDPTRGLVVTTLDRAARGDHSGPAERAETTLVSAPDEALALEAPQCILHGDELTVLYGIAAAPLDPLSSTPLASLVLARSTDRGRTFTARTRVTEPELAMLHPAMAREASGTIALVYYAGRSEPDAFAAFRWRRVRKVGAPADEGREARAPVYLAARRNDPKWAGERVVVAAASGLLGTAFVENLDGTHVAFVELGP